MDFWRRVQEQPGGPNAVALRLESGEELTFAALLQRSASVAGQLEALGTRPGDRVALLARNGPWFFDLLLACARLGAVLVPVNARLAAPELAFILGHCNPRVLVVDDAVAADTSGWPGTQLGAAALRTDGVGPAMAGGLPGDAVLLQMYTSGTTGKPKGAMLTHANLLATAAAGAKALGPFDVGGRSLVCLPLFHIAAVDWALFALVTGSCVVLQSEVRPAAIVEALHRHRIDNTLLVPAAVRMVVEEVERRGQPVPTLRCLCFGASPMPEELITRARAAFPQARLRHVYGMTESTGMFTALPPEQIENGRRLLSCGKPLTGELRIVDDDGAPVAAGEVGHVVYRGPQAMAGYWADEEATRAALRDGWLQTGDIGRVDAEGYLYVLDRSKDLVKPGGENVYPAEVENVLSAHPDVADVAVIGLPDAQWGEVVTAVVVARAGRSPDLEDLQAHARGRLAGFKLPRRLHVVDQLPRNAAGKVQKHLLRRDLSPAVPGQPAPPTR